MTTKTASKPTRNQTGGRSSSNNTGSGKTAVSPASQPDGPPYLVGPDQWHKEARGEFDPLPFPQAWAAIVGELSGQMTRATFNTWFKEAKAAPNFPDVGGSLVVVGDPPQPADLVIYVTNDYAREWLAGRLDKTVTRIASDIFGRPTLVAYRITPGPGHEPPGLVRIRHNGTPEELTSPPSHKQGTYHGKRVDPEQLFLNQNNDQGDRGGSGSGGRAQTTGNGAKQTGGGRSAGYGDQNQQKAGKRPSGGISGSSPNGTGRNQAGSAVSGRDPLETAGDGWQWSDNDTPPQFESTGTEKPRQAGPDGYGGNLDEKERAALLAKIEGRDKRRGRPYALPMEPKPPTPGAVSIDIVQRDPMRAHLETPHYALRFWGPYIAQYVPRGGSGSPGRYAFQLWEALRSYYFFVARYGAEPPTLKMLCETLGVSDSRTLIGRPSVNGKPGKMGAVQVLEALGICRHETAGDNPGNTVHYFRYVLDDLPLMTPAQVAKLSPLKQAEHTAFLSYYDFNRAAWAAVTEETFIQPGKPGGMFGDYGDIATG